MRRGAKLPDDYGQSDAPDWREFDWSANSAFTEPGVSKGRVHYVRMGKAGPGLILVHGIGNSWRFWLETIPNLANDYQVVAVDLPGFGQSVAPAHRLTVESVARAVTEVADNVGLDTFSLCGHSMGALVAAHVAATSSRVRSLVLVSGTLFSATDFFQSPMRALRSHPRVIANLVGQAIGGGVALPQILYKAISHSGALRKLILAPFMERADRVSPDLLDELFKSVGGMSTAFALTQGMRFQLSHVLEKVECSISAINGERDQLIVQADVARLRNISPNAKVAVIEGVGHWPMIERPKAFNDRLRHMLR